MNYYPIEQNIVKHGFTTHAIPMERMAGIKDFQGPPQIGDLVLAEVMSLGHHKRLEVRAGVMWHIFPGDLIAGAFGNRYATDQFEGYVPTELVHECDLLSVGGVCGQVASRHPSMNPPTRLRIHGAICDSSGEALNLRSFSLPSNASGGRIILVVGSSMNAGKTTTVGTLARALKQGGFRVAAAKITGTAAGKDARFFTSCGARPVLDFTFAGYPSTYMLSLEELLTVHRTLIGNLRETNPDYILVEIADGIFQRETKMLLECAEFRQDVEHAFFAANDSLSAACGAHHLKEYGIPLRAIAGAFTQSALAMREAEVTTGVRCLNLEQMLAGGVLETMGIARRETSGALLPMVPDSLLQNGNGHSNGSSSNGNGSSNGSANGNGHTEPAVIEDEGDVRLPDAEPVMA